MKLWRKRRIEIVPGLSWNEFALRVWTKTQAHNVFGRAAELAYFFLFSIFPLLIVLTSILGLVSSGIEIRGELLRYFRTALPRPAYQLVNSTLHEITDASGGGKLSIGIIITIASAAAGMVAVIEGLNTAYEVREARSWLRRRGLAIGLTVALEVFTILGMAVFLYGTQLGTAVAERVGFKPFFASAWRFLQWPLVMLFVLGALALVYRLAPNVRTHWQWILPGAVTAFLVWLGASAGLQLYLRFFDTYSTIYGSLGALMILMIWFYLFGVAILVGGEVNSVLENAAAEAGDPAAKLAGEKAPAG